MSFFSFSFKNKFIENKQTKSQGIEARRDVMAAAGGVLSAVGREKPSRNVLSLDLGHHHTGVPMLNIH